VYHFDGETQKHFNRMHSQFLMVSCNVYLGLCTNKFNTFRSFTAFYFYRISPLQVRWFHILLLFFKKRNKLSKNSEKQNEKNPVKEIELEKKNYEMKGKNAFPTRGIVKLLLLLFLYYSCLW